MKIAVIGAGLMGSGIAQTCAQAGYEVKNIDVFEPAIEKAKENIEKIFVKKIRSVYKELHADRETGC